ncbi:MAG TPA: DUF3426 domain-containing protein [Rhizomicrobium sp.]|nr:DUF3426 domain-containing protein [Rhizomicrobium sp.]
MILTCPACTTRYTVDEAKFPASGRTVRCAKCGHSWHQPGPEPEPAPEPEIAPAAVLEPEPDVTPAAAEATQAAVAAEPEPPLEEPFGAPSAGIRAYAPPAQVPERFREQKLQTAAVVAGWVGLVAVVLLIGYSAVRYRQDIAAIWPQSAGVYSGLGMPVNSSGIDFRNVTYRRESEDGQSVLVVTGQIVNGGARELPVPQTVRVGLTDIDNRELYHWTFKPDATVLKPGAQLPFRTRLSSPPAAARFAVVTFAKE